jgi:regulator of sirC expression with transglutaminase-like and TPR domain
MDTASQYRQLFADAVGRLGEDLDLARVTLYIEGEDMGDVDVSGGLGKLDRLASKAGDVLGASMDMASRLQSLSLYMSVKEGFTGDANDYYNPDNVYLNRVLDRRRGMPIALSLVYMEVGLRLGIQFDAIGLPGHLVIRAITPKGDYYIDPFHRGRVISMSECVDMVGKMYGDKVELHDRFFEPYTKKQFLIRLLSNLKGIYSRSGEYAKALAAADRIALLEPNMQSNLKERSWIFQQMGQFKKAIEDLENYLKAWPQVEDAKQVKSQIQGLWKTIATLN